MACQIRNIAGLAEIVEDGVTGLLAAALTPASMTSALEHLWTRRTEAEMIGTAGPQRIRQIIPLSGTIFADRLVELAGLAMNDKAYALGF
jgi:hypothetical protein